MLGLLPEDVILVPKGKAPRVPLAVVEELAMLKALYTGFAYRELARIIVCTLGYRMHHQTIKKLWQQSPGAVQEALALGDYHRHSERYEARGPGAQALRVPGAGE